MCSKTLCVVVCDVHRQQLSHAVAAAVLGNSCARARAWPFPLDVDQLEHSFLSSFELARVIHQAHCSTTPNQVLFASVRLFPPTTQCLTLHGNSENSIVISILDSSSLDARDVLRPLAVNVMRLSALLLNPYTGGADTTKYTCIDQ